MSVAKQYPLGAQLIASILDRRDIDDVMALGDVEPVLLPHEADAWRYVRTFVAKHGEIPTRDVFRRHCDLPLPKEAPDPPAYYAEHLEVRHIDLTLKQGVREANEKLTGDTRDPRAALAVMQEMLQDLWTGDRRSKVRDFRGMGPDLLVAHNQAFAGTDKGIPLGWETLDRQTGGMKPGDLYSFVGRPAVGKTWFVLSGAYHAWKAKQASVLVVTIEMPSIQIAQRLGAIHGKVAHNDLRLGRMTTRQEDRFRGAMIEAEHHPVPMWIVDGTMATTVDDLIMLRQQLNPDTIFVDGAYLLSHRDPMTNSNNTRKVHAVCNQLKNELAMGTEVSVAASWQFNRDAVKSRRGKRDGPPGLEDIADSDAIGRNSSVVIGLMEQETAGSIDSKLISLLKGRDGETGQWRTRWDFEMMDFSEIEDERNFDKE